MADNLNLMTTPRLFGSIKQFGYLVKDLDSTMQSWVEHIGVGPFWGFRNVQLLSHFAGEQTEITIDVGLAYQAGVQIEFIHQTDNGLAYSPYSSFYQTDVQQYCHHIAYYCLDIDAGRDKAKRAGLVELGYVESGAGVRYYYYDSPTLNGLIIELMQVDQLLVDAFDFCAEQTADWQGEDPYRLITM